MKNAYKQTQATRLSHILTALPRQANANLREFVRQFYAKIPLSDLEKMAPPQAVAVATSAYGFMEKRDSSAPKIRVFNANHKQHGYELKHTVIELLNDDMPFLVDSLSAELQRLGLTIRETIHPVFHVERDTKGQLQKIAADASAKGESLIHFEVSSLQEGMTPKQLETDLAAVLTHIRVAVDDFRSIVDKAHERIAKLDKARAHFDQQTVAEVADFLRWLIHKNFVFLGYAEYNFFDASGKEVLSVEPSSRLGVLKIDDEISPHGLEALPPELRHFLLVPQLIEITKSNRRSLVHRSVPMDYIGLKRFDTKGKVVGEARFLGLFTSNVYYQSADVIPFARQKIAQVLERSEFAPSSHDGKSLKTILEFMPRDEVFQMQVEDLFEVSMGILALEAKPGVRMFVRRDAFERFVSLMVFVPREQFSTDLRRQIQKLVERAFNGTVSSFATQITEAPLTRLHLIVKTTPGEIPQVDIGIIEQEIAKRAYMWSDLLQEALISKYGEPRGEKWHRLYMGAFPQSYINRHDTFAAAFDVKKIEDAIASDALVLDLFRTRGEGEGFLHLKIYNPREEIALSDILPLLENAGFRVIEEHPFQITPHGLNRAVWIRDFKLQIADLNQIALAQVKPLLEEALLKVWQRAMESDRFNALIMKASLTWRQVTMLRSYAQYLKQIGFASSPQAIAMAFSQHPKIAAQLVALFEARFDPAEKNHELKEKTLRQSIEDALADVSNATEDRILRRYVQLIEATLRTNYFQTAKDGGFKPVLSFKLNSHAVPELPLPKPYAEIFVYGMRVEGIHLRGGKVARGGLRWSDRHEDYRTEVLGLMKAQMVKNSVIVPVGSKGGFIVKQPPQNATREALLEEGIACYKMYLSGLLDITDNIVKGKVTQPPQAVRHDGDDPYLVVAADKGTATFSDIANSVSADYGFWLGDAFASGGSVGYDHKAMAITARGGWVSVTRHFLEMGVDIGKQDFTCVGIGDMAGDVFGNGMLLSDHIKLLAAFNHQHIFIDPNPDAKASFAERKRLFSLPRSSWKDYDAKLISKGGGVFERSAKAIVLSKEAQAALGVSKASFTPDELIKAILLAPADLLWNGGIGTYVKAEDESNEAVGDRANNAVRVNGRELRCKVVGEGGNLGFTQKGRIEYAKNGGRLNTDAIDNSAGVDCSDHEVNIKIAFSHELSTGSLTLKERNKLLAAMTDEVARLVIKDNILQTQAVSIAERQGVALLESQTRLMHALEREGLLDRAIEFLPSDKQIADLKAARKGLTRPELAVLLAYSKMSLYKHLLDSNLPDDAYFTADLQRYFPKAMREKFAQALSRHPLKREIIATVVTNSLVNRAGSTFASDMAQDLNVPARDVAVAYSVVRDVYGLRTLWNDIEASAAAVPPAAQAQMHDAINRFLERTTSWFLRNLPLPLDIDAIVAEITPAVADIAKHQDAIHSDITRAEAKDLAEKLIEQGVAKPLAESIAALGLFAASPDIIAVAQKNELSVQAIGRLYFELGVRLGISWLRQHGSAIASSSYWERLAVLTLLNDLYDEQRRLTDSAATHKGGLEGWMTAHKEEIERLSHFTGELQASGGADLSKLTLALKHVRALAQ